MNSGAARAMHSNSPWLIWTREPNRILSTDVPRTRPPSVRIVDGRREFSNAMPFLGIRHQSRCHAVLAQGVVKLECFRRGRAPIQSATDVQSGRSRVVCMHDGAALDVSPVRVGVLIGEKQIEEPCVRASQTLADSIGDERDRHRRGKAAVVRDQPCRHESAVSDAGDAQPIAVREPTTHEVIETVKKSVAASQPASSVKSNCSGWMERSIVISVAGYNSSSAPAPRPIRAV